MALIVKCRKCKKRIPKSEAACFFCGGSDFRFIIDYRPFGRYGGRRHLTLPDDLHTAEEARESERSFNSARIAKRTVSRSASSMSTVADLLPDYMKWYKLHRATSTCRDVNFCWKASLEPLLGHYPVREISGEHFSLYQQSRKAGLPIQGKTRKCRLGRFASNRTINKELDYFKGFLRWCRREKKIEIEAIQYDVLPYHRPIPIVLSVGELEAILKAAEAEPIYRTFFLCLYSLGLRFSEARFLRAADFDFANRSVRVRQKGGTWKILPLDDEIIAAVKALVEENIQNNEQSGAIVAENQLPAEGKVEDYLFVNPQTGKPIGDIRGAIVRICKAAGVKKKVTPHLFRHSVATVMMGAGVNLRTIQEYLGHAQSTTTEFYTHVALGHLRSAQGLIRG